MSPTPYPIVEHRVLGPVQRRMLRRGRRDAADLPKPGAGTVLVLEADGRFDVIPPRHLSGREEAVLDAVAAYLVDTTRDRRVVAQIAIPSHSATGDFQLQIVFQCTVDDAGLVARDNLTDVAGWLRDYLSEDPNLHKIGYDFDVDDAEDVVEVRQRAQARVTAWCSVRPPQLPGVTVKLVNVEVGTPDDLRRHRTALRSTRQAHELTDAHDDHRIARTQKYEDEIVARGPRGLDSMALVDGELTASELANRERTQRYDELHLLTETLEMLQKSGHLDRMDFNPQWLAEELSLRLTSGRDATRSGQTPALSGRLSEHPEPQRSLDNADGSSDPDEKPSRPQERSWYVDDDSE